MSKCINSFSIAPKPKSVDQPKLVAKPPATDVGKVSKETPKRRCHYDEPARDDLDWGLWSLCNLPLDVEGKATDHVHEMPKFTRIQDKQAPTRLAVVATQSMQPPLGNWVKWLPFQFEPQFPFWKTCGTLVEIKNGE